MHKILLLLSFILLSNTSLAQSVAFAPTSGDELPPAILGNVESLSGENVNYFAANAATTGYLAVPEGSEPRGAVILIHEWNGLVDRVKETADSFAAEGYVALAVDLYSGRLGANPEENIALIRETQADSDQVIANLNAAAEFLRARSDVSGKIATIGWCFGGGIALSYAIGGDNHEGTAIFYGSLLDDPEQMQHIHHEIYGTFAANDQGIPVESVNAFVAAMRAAGIENDVHIYDDISHGFWLHVDQDAEARTPSAQDAWKRLKAYLQRTIGE
ncbi:dienelactone hydrolase family protein [Gammaproteobacteria bacterium]|nr:dienelactone hydrolase family protein [Gammaproteobacteria bacterium]